MSRAFMVGEHALLYCRLHPKHSSHVKLGCIQSLFTVHGVSHSLIKSSNSRVCHSFCMEIDCLSNLWLRTFGTLILADLHMNLLGIVS